MFGCELRVQSVRRLDVRGQTEQALAHVQVEVAVNRNEVGKRRRVVFALCIDVAGDQRHGTALADVPGVQMQRRIPIPVVLATLGRDVRAVCIGMTAAKASVPGVLALCELHRLAHRVVRTAFEPDLARRCVGQRRRLEIQHAGQRIAAPQRTLCARQDFDARRADQIQIREVDRRAERRIVDVDAVDHHEQMIRLGAAQPHFGEGADAARLADGKTRRAAQQVGRHAGLARVDRIAIDDLDRRGCDVDRRRRTRREYGDRFGFRRRPRGGCSGTEGGTEQYQTDAHSRAVQSVRIQHG